MTRALLLALLLLPALANAQAKTYRWVDAQGQVHFGQVPPASGEYQVVRPGLSAAPKGEAAQAPAAEPKTAAPASAAPSMDEFLQQAQTEREAREQRVAQEKEARTQKQRQCQTAQSRMALLDALPGRRFATVAPDGEVTRLDDNEFENRRVAAQKDVDAHCR